MNKLTEIHPLGGYRLELAFSDGFRSVWDGEPMLARQGSLLVALREPDYFARCFIDAGALCWPNGLELSPNRLREQVGVSEHA
jgi:hypothetical protein